MKPIKSKNIVNVLIVDDDSFAAGTIEVMLSRDVRTRSAGHLTYESYTNWCGEADLVLFCIEGRVWNNAILEAVTYFNHYKKAQRILLLCTHVDPEMLHKLVNLNKFSGCLAKSEALYSLPSAIHLAVNGSCLVTPTVTRMIKRSSFQEKTLVLGITRYQQFQAGYSDKAKHILKLGMIFNLSQFEIHNELALAENYIAQVMSQAYSDLQIPELADKKTTLEELFADNYLDNQVIFSQYSELTHDLNKTLERRKENGQNHRFRNMASLAFHLLTIPEITKWELDH